MRRRFVCSTRCGRVLGKEELHAILEVVRVASGLCFSCGVMSTTALVGVWRVACLGTVVRSAGARALLGDCGIVTFELAMVHGKAKTVVSECSV